MIYDYLVRFKKLNKLIMILTDVTLINLGYYLAFLLKFSFNVPERNLGPFINIIPVIALITLIYFSVYELVSLGRRTLLDTIFTLIIAITMIVITTMALTFFFRGFAFPRSIFPIAWMIQLGLLSLWRYILHNLQRKVYKVKKVMLIGDIKATESIAIKLMGHSRNWFEVKYIFKPSKEELPPVDFLMEVDSVVITDSVNSIYKSNLIELAQKKGIEVYVVPDIYEMQILNAKIDQFDGMMVFKIKNMELTLEQRIIKRTVDFIISVIGIIVSFPLMMIVAVLIKLDSKGTILYKQERLSIKQKKFYVYKFRTMIEDAEKETGPVMADKDDFRITRLGSFLRSSRLDELPQLFNVFIGHMSMVGPRPERQHFVSQYVKASSSYSYRMNVKAGVTGLAQILGKYATTYEEKLKFDLLYIRNYSILLDLKIVLKTVKVVLTKEKATGIDHATSFNRILTELGLSVYEEIGVTRIE